MNDLDDLLAGLNALDDFLAEGFGFNAIDEIAGNLEIDIGFQQSQTDFTERITDVGLGDFAETSQVAEAVLQLAGQGIEHPDKLSPGGGIGKERVDKTGGAWLTKRPCSAGRLPKWPTGADCKSAGLRLRWFESITYHHLKLPRNTAFLSLPRRGKICMDYYEIDPMPPRVRET